MLASLLPGLRDVRTPLVLGWAWFIFLWVAVSNRLPGRNSAEGLVLAVYEGITALEVSVRLTLLTFLAYLVGSLVQVERVRLPSPSFRAKTRTGVSFVNAGGRTVLLARDPDHSLITATVDAAPPAVAAMVDHVGRLAGELTHRAGLRTLGDVYQRGLAVALSDRVSAKGALERAIEWLYRDMTAAHGRLTDEAASSSAAGLLAAAALSERTQLETRLLSEKPEIYDHYDRFMQSFALRMNLALPVLAISLATAIRLYLDGARLAGPPIITAGVTAFLGGLIAVTLHRRSLEQKRQADIALVTAVVSGLIASPLLGRWQAVRTNSPAEAGDLPSSRQAEDT